MCIKELTPVPSSMPKNSTETNTKRKNKPIFVNSNSFQNILIQWTYLGHIIQSNNQLNSTKNVIFFTWLVKTNRCITEYLQLVQ